MAKERVDRDKWSKESQRSYSMPRFYEDKEYLCVNCGRPAVYTAVDQKIDFEQRKIHMASRRVLCSACFKEKHRVEKRIAKFQREWPARKRQLDAVRNFAAEWLRLLELHPTFGVRRNRAMIAMLRRVSGGGQKTYRLTSARADGAKNEEGAQ